MAMESMTVEEQLPHLRLHPNCGACSMRLQLGEKTTTITFDLNRHPIVVDTSEVRLSYWPKQGYGHYDLCQMPDCDRCNQRPYTINYHNDCLSLYKKLVGGDLYSIRLLWSSGCWMYPWNGCQPLLLPPDHHFECQVHLAAQAINPRIGNLPPELALMVLGFSGNDAMLWRMLAVAELAERLNPVINLHRSFPGDFGRVRVDVFPLFQVDHWKRGDLPVTSAELSENGIIQLVFDAQGLREIRRFKDSLPEAIYKPSYSLLYMTGEAKRFSNMRIQYLSGLGRLEMHGVRDLSLWDIPALPIPLTIRPAGLQPIPSIPRVRTVSLKDCTGLTVFIHTQGFSGIHAHTPESPYATETFDTFSNDVQAWTAWHYVPLPANEGISMLGLRLAIIDFNYHQPCLLIQRLGGDRNVGDQMVIGPSYAGDTVDLKIQLETSRPTILYQTPTGSRSSIFSLGVAPNPSEECKTEIFQITPRSPPFRDATHSLAPLHEVASLTVFRDESFSACKGILFEYKDKTQRSVGQCRLGVDPNSTYEAPIGLYYAAFTYFSPTAGSNQPAVFVQVATEAYPNPERSPERAWQFSAMSGTMIFWFDRFGSALQVRTVMEDMDVRDRESDTESELEMDEDWEDKWVNEEYEEVQSQDEDCDREEDDVNLQVQEYEGVFGWI